jgi:S-adenosylmethionine:tRNA ribosyltransferase-isomerase
MRLDELDYNLPTELIAQRPLEQRDASRLLSLDRGTGAIEDRTFRELPELLRGDELLVLNNARVIPARLFGHRAGVHSQAPSKATLREHLTGNIEVLLTKQVEPDVWEALVRPGRKLPVGERIRFGGAAGGEAKLEAEILTRGELGLRTLRFKSRTGESVERLLDRLGHIPLPPYIEREDESSDRERYQTVFAKRRGAIAAPTAGLHFTPEIFERIRNRGVEICELTLDVGLGTFQPIHAEKIEEHAMHAEAFEISEAAAEKIQRAKDQKRPIVAIGTTVVRALEAAALRAVEANVKSLVMAGRAEARIFIYPGFVFRVIDGLLTNFHLPKSTLLALICAFAGKENVIRAYRYAVEEKYRFYSYGDCMFIR